MTEKATDISDSPDQSRAVEFLIDRLRVGAPPEEIGALAAALPRTDVSAPSLNNLAGQTYDIVCSNSPYMGKKSLDLSLMTGGKGPLWFHAGVNRVTYSNSRLMEWSDGFIGEPPEAVRMGLVSNLGFEDGSIMTHAQNFHLDYQDRTKAPAFPDFSFAGKAADPERVKIVYFDGDYIVSDWRGHITVCQQTKGLRI